MLMCLNKDPMSNIYAKRNNFKYKCIVERITMLGTSLSLDEFRILIDMLRWSHCDEYSPLWELEAIPIAELINDIRKNGNGAPSMEEWVEMTANVIFFGVGENFKPSMELFMEDSETYAVSIICECGHYTKCDQLFIESIYRDLMDFNPFD